MAAEEAGKNGASASDTARVRATISHVVPDAAATPTDSAAAVRSLAIITRRRS